MFSQSVSFLRFSLFKTVFAFLKMFLHFFLRFYVFFCIFCFQFIFQNIFQIYLLEFVVKISSLQLFSFFQNYFQNFFLDFFSLEFFQNFLVKISSLQLEKWVIYQSRYTFWTLSISQYQYILLYLTSCDYTVQTKSLSDQYFSLSYIVQT